MANFDEGTQRKSGFFHSLGYVLTDKENSPANEKYKSSHNIQTSEIWVDKINFVQDFGSAEIEANNNNALTQYGDMTSQALLYPLEKTNYQTWFLDTGTPIFNGSAKGFTPTDGWIKPLVSPVDITDTDGSPSIGLSFRLFNGDGNEVPLLEGAWEVDYYAGLLKFNKGITPMNTGNGLGKTIDETSFMGASNKITFLENNGPRAIAFNYSGSYLSDESLGGDVYKVNTQVDMICEKTEGDGDVAVSELVEFEPIPGSAIDVLVNGLEVSRSMYEFCEVGSSSELNTVVHTGNKINVSGNVPDIGDYLNFDDSDYRKVVGISGQDITYSGYEVTSSTTASYFKATPRVDNKAKLGDILIWNGSTSYELDNEDLITFEYITSDSNAS